MEGGSITISEEVQLELPLESKIAPRGECTYGKKTFRITAYDNQLLDGTYQADISLYRENDTEKASPVYQTNPAAHLGVAAARCYGGFCPQICPRCTQGCGRAAKGRHSSRPAAGGFERGRIRLAGASGQSAGRRAGRHQRRHRLAAHRRCRPAAAHG